MSKFQLIVNLEIEQLDDRGYPMGRGGLQVRDVIQLGDLGFLELATVLGRFNDLAGVIKEEQESVDA
ncbi:MAG TPA: hypothetical protein VHA75_17765 [Rugosimonospora sp.]|nr:hypothetical protein [Rugosimonospora sp.]